ncbi:hypothetical protein C0993_005403 [Termitomyces sp. T159_Od127]|nr:hypothetical protein C0993_005403 [Termitomyces sp. T159_Od127]
MSFPIRRLPILTTRWHTTLFQRLPSFPRRCYSTPPSDSSSKIHLPCGPEEWSKHFKAPILINHRISVRNPATAATIADAFVPEGSQDKIIVEAYPGPGQLTRALLALPKERIKKLIVIENWEPYLEWLRPLQEVDPRVELVEMNPFLWDTYTRMTELGILNDVQKIEWNKGVHPQLQFISHLPSTVYSEQLLSQFLRSMPEGHWLFSYGRIPLSFILSEHLYRRVVAAGQDRSARCKLSVVAEATAECTAPLDFATTQPYEQHFHPFPSIRSLSIETKKDARAIGRPFRTMNIVPLENQIVAKGQMDTWDFCLRRLYVKKSTPLKDAINILAPNSRVLIGAVTNPNLPESERLDVSKKIRDMEAHEWAIFMKAFDNWPFKPSELTFQEGYSSSLRSL